MGFEVKGECGPEDEERVFQAGEFKGAEAEMQESGWYLSEAAGRSIWRKR